LALGGAEGLIDQPQYDPLIFRIVQLQSQIQHSVLCTAIHCKLNSISETVRVYSGLTIWKTSARC